MQNIPRKVPENVLVRKTFFCNPLYPHVIHREKTIDKPYIGLKKPALFVSPRFLSKFEILATFRFKTFSNYNEK